MKPVILYLFLAAYLVTNAVHAQGIYMKFVQYGNTGGGGSGSNAGTDGPIASAGLGQPGTTQDGPNTTVQLIDYVQVASFQFDQQQTLNIGSTSGGAGAGKITFNPLTITKAVDALSPKLFQAMASGTAYKRIEILFTKGLPGLGTTVYYKVILKLVAVKSMAVSSVDDCTDGCAAESVSFEYGGMQIYTYKPQTSGFYLENPVHGGWDRLINSSDQ